MTTPSEIVLNQKLRNLEAEVYRVRQDVQRLQGSGTVDGSLIRGRIDAQYGEIGEMNISPNGQVSFGDDATLAGSGVLTLGSGNNSVIADSTDATYRLWAGHADAASAPFSVTKAGALNATSGSISGSLITSGIDASNITTGTLDASVVTVTNLNASNITTGTLDASVVTVTNLNATNITTGTLIADRISGGSLGGDFSLGTSDITVNSTGKIYFGSGGNDYLDNNLIHLESSGSAKTGVEFTRSGYSPSGDIQSLISSTYGLATLRGIYSSTKYAAITAWGYSTAASTGITLTAYGSHPSNYDARYSVSGDGTHKWETNTSTTAMSLARTNRALSLYGRLYPGTGSATQSSRYLYDDGSRHHFIGDIMTDGQVYVGGSTSSYLDRNASITKIYNSSYWAGVDGSGRFIASGNVFPQNQTSVYVGANGGYLRLSSGTSGTATAGAATLPANPVGFLILDIGGTARKFPYYAL